MPAGAPDDFEEIDREIRINELRHQARDLAGGEMISWEADDAPPDVSEGFWSGVVAYESASWTTHLEQLERAGMTFPDPETLDDRELAAELGRLIDGLASIRVFLYQTDHLSDRELYQDLWGCLLRDEVKDLPVDESSAWHLDILGCCSEEDLALSLKYYADDKQRRRWAEQFPDDKIPEHEDPPFDRDRHLPRP